MSEVNLDHQAGARLAPEVLQAMQPFLVQTHHPASLHRRGIRARETLENTRRELGQLLGVTRNEDLSFPGSAREAIEQALHIGCALRPQGRRILLSAIESPPLRRWLEPWQRRGYTLHFLPAGEHGIIRGIDLQAALNEETALVCLPWVHQEIGTIQPMPDLAQVCVDQGVPLFVDATAAAGWLPIDLRAVPITLMMVNSLRMGGPAGLEALYSRGGIPSSIASTLPQLPQIEDLAGIAGWGATARLAREQMTGRQNKICELQKKIWNFASTQMEDVHLLGPPLGPDRIGYHLNLSAPGAEGEALALKLDLQGFTVASRPVCELKEERLSPVLQALGVSPELSKAQILLTLGDEYGPGEIERFCLAYQKCVRQLRALA